ncbi:hypothetical protein, partial [Pseudomonas sp.]|uniref:hypothetical protein n=1 Tax=Pseudomonas sp. TaxID=306 RepID=UPI003265B754
WVEVHFFNAGIGTHHGDGLLMEIGSTASAISYPLGMWGSWSGYNPLHAVYQTKLGSLFWGRVAAQREQAPSPQKPADI